MTMYRKDSSYDNNSNRGYMACKAWDRRVGEPAKIDRDKPRTKKEGTE